MFSDGLVSLPTFYLESAFRNPLKDENSGASTAVSVPCNTGLSGMRRMHQGSAWIQAAIKGSRAIDAAAWSALLCQPSHPLAFFAWLVCRTRWYHAPRDGNLCRERASAVDVSPPHLPCRSLGLTPPSLCFLLCLLPPLGLHAASSGHFGVCGQSPQSKSMLNQGCDWQTRKQQWNLIFHGKVSAPCLYAQWRWFLFTSCVVGVFKLHGLCVRLKSYLIFIMAKSNSRETFLGDRKPVHVPSTGQNTIERDKRMLHLESAIYGSDYGKQPAFFRFQMLT